MVQGIILCRKKYFIYFSSESHLLLSSSQGWVESPLLVSSSVAIVSPNIRPSLAAIGAVPDHNLDVEDDIYDNNLDNPGFFWS